MMATSYNAKDEDGHITVTGPGAGTVRSRKPENTAFKQQRLPAWQPILTAGSVLPAFFIIGLMFIPIGIGLFVSSNNIKEFEIDYTGVDMSSPCFNCSQNYSWNSTRPCSCSIPFYLDQPYESNVFMYYGLSNFYQNHRRYVKSRDDSQLNGNIASLTSPSKECEPYANHNNKPIAPCGAIANSMFNDSLELFYIDPNGTRVPIPLTATGIAWWTDKHVKFRNPAGDSNLTVAFQGTTKPVNWRRPVYELDSDPENNGFINEDFIVWMRTAALPTFRKLYRVIQKKNNMVPTLPRGNYSLEFLIFGGGQQYAARRPVCRKEEEAEVKAEVEFSGALVCGGQTANMNRHLFRLQQVARRTISSSARRQVENKVPQNQKHFQEDNGMPVHLKGGAGDALLYRTTMTLTVVGAGYVVYELVKAAFPQKKV